MMGKTVVRILFLTCVLLITVSQTGARTVVKYRHILGQFASMEEAQEFSDSEPASEVITEGTSFIVVKGWFNQYNEVVKNHKNHIISRGIQNRAVLLQQQKRIDNPRIDWKNVLPVEMEESAARTRGLPVSRTLFEKGKEQHAVVLGQSRAIHRLIQSNSDIITQINNKRIQNQLSRSEEITLRKQAEDVWLDLAERSTEPNVQGEARINLGKLYYEQGLEINLKRIERFKGKLEPHDDMDAEEETAYDSALEQFSTIVEQFPDTPFAEEACYYKAATMYHLTNRGHPVYQKQKAVEAYQEYVDRFPRRNLAARAVLNIQGLMLELARLDKKDYSEVIQYGNLIRFRYGHASDYVRSRSMMMMAETYYEHMKDYDRAISICEEIISEFSIGEQQSVLGTAHRVNAYCYFNLGEYENAIATWNRYIGNYLDGKFNFDYQVEAKQADAYYWRGLCKERLGQLNEALRDYRIAATNFPNTQHGQTAQINVNILEYR